MGRDRLQEFLQKGNIKQEDASEVEDTPAQGFDPPTVTKLGDNIVIEMGSIDGDIGRFLREVQSFRERFADIRSDIDKIKHVQEDLLNSPSQNEEKEKELDQLMASVKVACKELMTKIKEMEQSNSEMLEKMDTTDASDMTLARIQGVQHKALLRSFKELLEYYQEAQLDYQEKCKARVKTLLVIRNGKTGGSEEQLDKEIEEFLESGNFGSQSIFTDGYQEKTEEAREELALADARLDQLRKVETALRELHDLFIDMARLVELQGEQLDNIEKNVLEAAEIVDGARGQLANAQKLQKSARKKLIIIIIVLLILAVIIGIVLYVEFK